MRKLIGSLWTEHETGFKQTDVLIARRGWRASWPEHARALEAAREAWNATSATD